MPGVAKENVEVPVNRLRLAFVFEVFVQWLVSVWCGVRNSVGARERFVWRLRGRETGW